MTDFTVNQKVVCIDDKFAMWVKNLYVALPKEGEVYVIRSVRIGTGFDENGRKCGKLSLLLVGLINPYADKAPPNSLLAERGFDSDRFRPLDEIKEESKNKQSEGVEVLKPQELVEAWHKVVLK